MRITAAHTLCSPSGMCPTAAQRCPSGRRAQASLSSRCCRQCRGLPRVGTCHSAPGQGVEQALLNGSLVAPAAQAWLPSAGVPACPMLLHACACQSTIVRRHTTAMLQQTTATTRAAGKSCATHKGCQELDCGGAVSPAHRVGSSCCEPVLPQRCVAGEAHLELQPWEGSEKIGGAAALLVNPTPARHPMQALLQCSAGEGRS